MHTNMEFSELLNAVEEAYKNNKRDVSDLDLSYPDVSNPHFLVTCILENYYFEFNEKNTNKTLDVQWAQQFTQRYLILDCSRQPNQS